MLADIWRKVLSSQTPNSPRLHFYLFFLSMVHQNLTLSALDYQLHWAAHVAMKSMNTGTSYLNSVLFTTDIVCVNGSGWLKSSVRGFIKRIIFNNFRSLVKQKYHNS